MNKQIPHQHNNAEKPEVLLWLFSVGNLSDLHWTQIEHILTTEEKTVALRKRHSAVYKASRAIARLALAQLLHVVPRTLVFEKHEKGKPFLPSHPHIGFNVSHSGDWIAFAATRSTNALGVDIECHSERDHLSIAEHYFHADEIEALKHAQDSSAPFFQYWTLKEAFFKALGSGIVTGLSRINLADFAVLGQFTIDPALKEYERDWSLHYQHLCQETERSLAIALKSGQGFHISHRDFLTDLTTLNPT